MKTTISSAQEQFLALLETQFSQNLKGISPLQKSIREKAWDHFLELGLPEKKQAGFEYVPLQQLYAESFVLSDFPHIDKESFSSLIFPECQRQHLIFVNGQYAPHLSDISGLPKEVIVMSLKDALQSHGSFLQGRLARSLKEESDPFASLNLALIQKGLFVYVPPKTEIQQPIQYLHIVANDHPMIFSPRIHLFLGSMSKMQWISTISNFKDFDYFSNGVMDFTVEEGAHLEHLQMLTPDKHGFVFEAIRISLKKHSNFKHIGFTTGAKSVRQSFRVQFLGENASCDLKGLAFLNENKQSHINIMMDHEAPHCQSMQLFKNILHDISRASFEGKIYIHSKAQKTQAYQLNKNLLLNPGAIANSKPNLEIFADDVKASHGATVTQFQSGELFYLKSRGIPEKIAKKLLLTGFSLDILQDIPLGFVREHIQKMVKKFIA